MTTLRLAAAVRGPGRTGPRGRPVPLLAGAVVALVVLAAALAPLIAPHDPNAVDPLAVSLPPGAAHWLGTDDTGRDIASRLLYGARPSLLAPLAVTLAAGTIGTALAVSAAWLGGWWDRLVTAALDLVFGFPGLVLAVVGAALFGAGLPVAVATLTIAYLPYVARVVRGSALRERHLPYVAALRMLGLGGARACLRHLLPNLAPLVLVQTATAFGYTLLDTAAFSFIGLGAQPPTAEWGLMVAQGAPGLLAGRPEQALAAGGAIVLFTVACGLLGTALSQRLAGDRT
ncbi:ABC transporter permease [Kitasatospora phosalacinea]|uniref:ABC transporter permease n=1 Tax=Kitasatospora phosalacinea TaxID=2065 RepID=UPI00052616BC|nr:ABC transporter permease [Kitasatospora phosalacinea]